jgi:hypothetical protein
MCVRACLIHTRRDRYLVQTAALQINRYDDIGDGVEYELNVLRVGGTRQVAIDLFGGRFILGDELCLDVLGGRVELVRPGVLGKTYGERRALDLVLEQILLVEEQNDGRVDEPLVVADRVEETQRLVHAVGRLVLVQDLVVLAERHAEDDRCDVLEAVDPLLALGALAAHVEQPKVEVLEREVDLDDAGGFDARAQNVLLAGQEVGGADAVELIEKVLRRVVELVLVGAHEALLHVRVRPQALHAGQQGRIERLRVLHALYDLQDACDVLLALVALRIVEVNVEHVHCSYDRAQRLNRIRVHNRPVLNKVLF